MLHVLFPREHKSILLAPCSYYGFKNCVDISRKWFVSRTTEGEYLLNKPPAVEKCFDDHTSHLSLPTAVVLATKKRDLKHEGLGNFERGWDFSRYASLLEKLRDDIEPMPSQKEVKAAIKECRTARNKESHVDHDPNNAGRTDFQLATLLEAARTCLPKINDLRGHDLEALYEKLNRLDDCLYHRENDVDTVV